jgi:NADPH:quinone reductase-like Zn-dependent oxidoreductase
VWAIELLTRHLEPRPSVLRPSRAMPGLDGATIHTVDMPTSECRSSRTPPGGASLTCSGAFAIPRLPGTPLDQLAKQIAAGALRTQIGKTFGLDDIFLAHRCMGANQAGGKIVVPRSCEGADGDLSD